MKKIVSKMWALMTIVLFLAVVPGCHDDDDDKTTDYAPAIAGTYEGGVAIENAENPTIQTVQILITPKAVNKVALEMDKQSLLGMTVNQVIAKDCLVTYDGSKYSVSGTTTATVQELPGANIPVAISGTIEGVTAKVTISVTIPGSTNPVSVIFNGTKK